MARHGGTLGAANRLQPQYRAHAGRDLINTHGLMESLVQYNDVSEAGWLTKDLGMFYGHNTDFANTEFRYNLVHDNHAEHCAMGIYFDHLSHNAIVHHNVVWNVGMDPIGSTTPATATWCSTIPAADGQSEHIRPLETRRPVRLTLLQQHLQ